MRYQNWKDASDPSSRLRPTPGGEAPPLPPKVDLLLDTGKTIVPVEVKLSGSPGVPRGLLECMKDLSCPHGFVLHGGEEEYSMGRGVRALPARLVARPDRLCEALRLPRRRPARD